ncbi:hypothetical protein HYU14_01100 [Candidatus Woesearchaeota archaeon]|nr:hypothetical protein [Candidatus Woesearchaeota archaeon]
MSFLNENKKSEGLPLNIIIIALLVLVVLVVVWLIFTGKIGAFSKSVETAQNKLPTQTIPTQPQNPIVPIVFFFPLNLFLRKIARIINLRV